MARRMAIRRRDMGYSRGAVVEKWRKTRAKKSTRDEYRRAFQGTLEVSTI